MSKEIRFKGIVATLAQIAADAFAGRISWASDLARPVHYYTDSDYAVLARKDVAETFPGVKITNQAGPVARMVQAGTDGTQSAVSAETARTTIGVVGAEFISIRLGDSTTNSTCWMKLCQVTLNSQYQRTRAVVVVEQMTNGLAANSTTLLLRVDQSAAMSGNSPLIEMVEEFNGPGVTVGYTLDQDDASAKVISFWVKTTIQYTTTSYTVMVEQASSVSISRTWGRDVTPVTAQPSGWTDASYTSKTVGSLKVTGQAGAVARMVQAGTDGTQSAVSAASARALIDAAQTAHTHTVTNLSNLGANWSGLLTSAKPTTLEGYGITDAQAALGYTPANRAGDTFSGQVVVTDPTNVVAQPKLLVSVGGGSASGEVGFHSDGASEGNKNWGAGVSRDLSCFRIMSYTDDWSGRTECIRVGTDYLDLSNAYANALAVGYKIGGLKVVGGRKIGWAAPTGTATRTTFATSTVTLQQLAERVKALIDDLTAHGLIGP